MDTKTTLNSLRVCNMYRYTHDGEMAADITSFTQSGEIQSGFSNLDRITNIYPGLYLLGAIPSLGKTTFVHQMCDQMAQNGEHILFFSLEQSILELTSKSLARILAIHDPEQALTSLQIRKLPSEDPRLQYAVSYYDQYSKRISMVECNFIAEIQDIEDYVRKYLQQQKVKPVVVIDYMQIIRSTEKGMTTKDTLDLNMRRLKKLQSDNKLVVLVISSLNRTNYMSEIDFESFKESGGLEYTADVVWGLQLSVIHDDVFRQANKINEKREAMRSAKMAVPRKIELVCLKNRFGISSYTCHFDYMPQFDYFEPADISVAGNGGDINWDPDGFVQIRDINCPFE